MSYMPESSLIAFVRRGNLNFERFVEVLSTRGYITEQDHEAGCSLASSAMEAARQEDFDALFKLLMPGRLNDIQLSCKATDAGGMQGAFSYALFNSNVVDDEEIKQVLVKENEEIARWHAQLPAGQA